MNTAPSAAEAEASRAVLAHHSKSFNFASRLLPPAQRTDAAILYQFCRTVDDAADEAANLEAARRAVDEIEAALDARDRSSPLVGGFLRLAARRNLELAPAYQLIKGVRSDLGDVRLPDERALLRYCYRVAGTVGLLMSALIGVTDRRARPHAIDLGIAMQLTNICRDVLEDAERGRCYLPNSWLRSEGLSADGLLHGEREDPKQLARVVVRALNLADRYYDSGTAGLHYIPFQPRAAIWVASRVYREIGQKLRRSGANPLAGRTVVSTRRKVQVSLRALRALSRPDVLGLVTPRHDAALHRYLEGLPGSDRWAGRLVP